MLIRRLFGTPVNADVANAGPAEPVISSAESSFWKPIIILIDQIGRSRNLRRFEADRISNRVRRCLKFSLPLRLEHSSICNACKSCNLLPSKVCILFDLWPRGNPVLRVSLRDRNLWCPIIFFRSSWQCSNQWIALTSSSSLSAMAGLVDHFRLFFVLDISCLRNRVWNQRIEKDCMEVFLLYNLNALPKPRFRIRS